MRRDEDMEVNIRLKHREMEVGDMDRDMRKEITRKGIKAETLLVNSFSLPQTNTIRKWRTGQQKRQTQGRLGGSVG